MNATACSARRRISRPVLQAGMFMRITARRSAKKAGRLLPLTMGNDGHCGGVAEARIARGDRKLSVLMLMPGSGLGSAFVGADGLPLTGETLTAMESAHMAAPLHLFGLEGKPHPCGCGKDWGCVRTLHRHRRPAASAGGKIKKISRPRTRQIHRAGEGKGFVAAQPRAKGRRAGAGDF